MTPIDYPTITVGEKTLVVRYSLAAQILMRRRGLPADLRAATAAENPDAMENWLKIFACMVDENFSDGSPTQYTAGKGPTSDYWATQIAPHELADITAVCNEAIKKVLEARTNRQASPPTAE